MSTDNNWRWGYGMYAIIVPFVMLPAIFVLLWLDHRAHKQGLLDLASDRANANEYEEKQVDVQPSAPKAPFVQRLMHILAELDAFGLLLLGFGWALVSFWTGRKKRGTR